MMINDKNIDAMDYDELNTLKDDLEQTIDGLEDEIKEHQYVLSAVVERINKMDEEEED